MNTNSKKGLGGILSSVLLIILLFNIFGCENYKEEAEKYVKQDVYRELGVVADKFDTEVIHKDGDERLVAVRYAVDGGDWMGSYCVYMSGEYVRNCTTMLPSGYDFNEHLEELIALFGI